MCTGLDRTVGDAFIVSKRGHSGGYLPPVMKGGKFMSDDASLDLSRRDLLKLGALAGATASLAPLASPLTAAAAATAPSDFSDATMSQLQGVMGAGQARSVDTREILPASLPRP